MNSSPSEFAVKRRQIIREVGKARADYARGKVKRGSAATLMRQLSGK